MSVQLLRGPPYKLIGLIVITLLFKLPLELWNLNTSVYPLVIFVGIQGLNIHGAFRHQATQKSHDHQAKEYHLKCKLWLVPIKRKKCSFVAWNDFKHHFEVFEKCYGLWNKSAAVRLGRQGQCAGKNIGLRSKFWGRSLDFSWLTVRIPWGLYLPCRPMCLDALWLPRCYICFSCADMCRGSEWRLVHARKLRFHDCFL